jgi:transposase
MYIRKKTSKNSPNISVQIVEGYRDSFSSKVKQRIVKHIGVACSEVELKQLLELAEYLKAQIEEERQPGLLNPEYMAKIAIESKTRQATNVDYKIDDYRDLKEEQRSIVGVHEAYGKVYEQIGFNKTVSTNPARHKHAVDMLRNLVMARITNPQSKRETVNILSKQFGISCSLSSVYRLMDRIDDAAIDRIQKAAIYTAKSMLGEKIDVLFYDATTLYFESFDDDELRCKGYSKDLKFNQTQVVLAIFVTTHGMPVGYEVFPGNTYEGNTLLQALDNLKSRFELNKIIFVADSGMLNEANLIKLEENGYKYIVGARIKNMSKPITKQILDIDTYQESIVDDSEKYLVKKINLKNNRKLIISHSKRRAYKNAKDRDDNLAKLKKKLSKNKNASSLISNFGYKKYFSVDGNSTIRLNEAKIAEDAQWDGLHGVITNDDDISIQSILSQYKGLWQVEETFRISKHDLKVRPIYHWTPKRIKAHIAIAFMALTCIRHLEYRIEVQKEKMSPERIRKALVGIQVSMLRHTKDKRLIAIPAEASHDAKTIYNALGLQLKNTPYQISCCA